MNEPGSCGWSTREEILRGCGGREGGRERERDGWMNRKEGWRREGRKNEGGKQEERGGGEVGGGNRRGIKHCYQSQHKHSNRHTRPSTFSLSWRPWLRCSIEHVHVVARFAHWLHLCMTCTYIRIHWWTHWLGYGELLPLSVLRDEEHVSEEEDVGNHLEERRKGRREERRGGSDGDWWIRERDLSNL